MKVPALLICMGILAVLFPLTACSNLYEPFAKKPSASEIETFDEFFEEGKAAMKEGSYARALALFDKAVTLKPSSTEARLLASTAVYLRYETVFLQATGLLIGSDDLFGSIDQVFSLPIYSNGALTKVCDYLDANNGYSLVKGEGDGIILSNSISANLNLLVAKVLLMPYNLLDINKNNIPNENTTNGDLIVLTAGAPGLNTNILNLDSLTSGMTDVQANIVSLSSEATNALGNSNFVSNFYALDSSLKLIHDNTIEKMLLIFSGVTVFDDMNSIFACLNRMTKPLIDADTEGLLTDIMTPLTNLESTNGILGDFLEFRSLSNVLGGMPLNEMHSNLNGHYAFSEGSVPYSYTNSPWIDLTNLSFSSTNRPSIQGTLFQFYTEYTNINALFAGGDPFAGDNLSNALSNFSGDMTNDLVGLTNLFSDFGDFSNFGGF